MSLTNSTEDNWILFQSRYDYIALPIALGVEVMKHMKMVSKSGDKVTIAAGDTSVVMISGEQMSVALVKAKMLPVEDKEK